MVTYTDGKVNIQVIPFSDISGATFEIDDSGMTYHRGGDAQVRKNHTEYVHFIEKEMNAVKTENPSPGTSRSTASIFKDSIFQGDDNVNIRFAATMAEPIPHIWMSASLHSPDHRLLDQYFRCKDCLLLPVIASIQQNW